MSLERKYDSGVGPSDSSRQLADCVLFGAHEPENLTLRDQKLIQVLEAPERYLNARMGKLLVFAKDSPLRFHYEYNINAKIQGRLCREMSADSVARQSLSPAIYSNPVSQGVARAQLKLAVTLFCDYLSRYAPQNSITLFFNVNDSKKRVLRKEVPAVIHHFNSKIQAVTNYLKTALLVTETEPLPPEALSYDEQDFKPQPSFKTVLLGLPWSRSQGWPQVKEDLIRPNRESIDLLATTLDAYLHPEEHTNTYVHDRLIYHFPEKSSSGMLQIENVYLNRIDHF
jgi:hypothetical protein